MPVGKCREEITKRKGSRVMGQKESIEWNLPSGKCQGKTAERKVVNTFIANMKSGEQVKQ